MQLQTSVMANSYNCNLAGGAPSSIIRKAGSAKILNTKTSSAKQKEMQISSPSESSSSSNNKAAAGGGHLPVDVAGQSKEKSTSENGGKDKSSNKKGFTFRFFFTKKSHIF
jgi:hypothetical protein